MFKVLWNALVYRPIFNILIALLYLFNGNLWWAIIVLTLIIRGVLWNVTKQQSAMQQWMGDMQQKLKELQEKYADDPQAMSRESMKLMKSWGMAPLKWCLGMLVQLPVFIGLLYVIRSFASGAISTDSIYSFLVPFAGKFTDLANINQRFFGLDLLKNHSIALTVVGCIFVYLQTKLTMMFQQQQPKPAAMWPMGQAMPDMSKMMWPMNLFMVFMMWSFIWSTPNGVWLYLVVTTIFSVVQYSIQNREMIKIKWATRGVDASKQKIVNSK